MRAKEVQARATRWLAAGLLLIGAASPAAAGNFVEPTVFASTNGVLDLLVIAQAQPVPTINYPPPVGNSTINPVGWVYQICPRAAALPNNQCPPGPPTVSDYGGVRLALQKGDVLKIRLVNRLPALDPVKVNHSSNPGGANLPLNLTNLHTHGMLVEARAPTLGDPTFGDDVFVEIYNSANGTPVPQLTHQHGSIVKDYADYRIDIPANHPSGAFWFHPHVHGISLNQVSSGLSGIISVGAAGDYAAGDVSGTAFPESNVRHLILKDMQVLAANPAQIFANGTAAVVDGEVLNQEASPFCGINGEVNLPPHGFCYGAGFVQASWGSTGGEFSGGRWYFTINGQQYPAINVTEADGELWRLTNASGSLTYDLQLFNNVTQAPMMMQLVSVDGVSINIPPSPSPGTMVQLAGGRFRVVACPASGSAGIGESNSPAVCVDQLVMMPSSRAEVYVTYRDQDGNIVAPPPGATAMLKQLSITTGPVGDVWPMIDLATVQFSQTGARNMVATALQVHGDALLANQAGGIFTAPVPNAQPAPTPAGCTPLSPGHHRRIFFGFPDTSNPDVLGLGYEEVDEHGIAIAATQVPVTAYDPTANTICVPLGPGQTPVRETWEHVNLATENHNFHIHQARFRYVQDGAPPDSPLAAALDPAVGAGVVEDNVPLPVAVANIPDVANSQNGYCSIAQWRSGQCTSTPVVVEITFSQLGQFVYHCHILAHEDGGMMAAIQVVPHPSVAENNSHDYNGDGKSDIAWRDSGGDLALWIMNGENVAQSAGIAAVSSNWQIVGQRDFDGDGKADILWRAGDGSLAIWFMNGTQVAGTSGVTQLSSRWSVTGTGDFNGDGKGDILWRAADGQVAIWLMNGAQVLQSADLGNVSSTWTVAGTGDFNGDGTSDILWRASDGSLAVWFMNGGQVLSAAALGSVPTSWSIVGTGDFNGDGKTDILWRAANGDLVMWLMNGNQVLQSADLGNVASTWMVAQIGDLNGDGMSDILWRASDGNLAFWLMDGTTVSSAVGIANVGTTWTMQTAN